MNRTVGIALVFTLLIGLVVWWRLRPDTEAQRSAALPDRGTEAGEGPALAAKSTGTNLPLFSRVTAEKDTTGQQPGETAKTNVTADLPYLEDELILRVSDSATMKRLEALLDEKGISIIRRVDQLGLVRVKLPDGMTIPDAEKVLAEIDEVAETIPNIRTEIPKDIRELPLLGPGRPLSPVLQKGKELIKCTDPARQSSFGRNVTVALLDTGVDETHPDLVERTLRGYNFVDDNADTTDLNSHGTACAGIIVGSARNEGGVSGVAPAAYLLPVKVMNNEGKGESFAVIEGIVYAVDRGAKVISLSIGTLGDSKILREAIDYAIRNGAVVVAAAGNEGAENVLLPAGYKQVVCVAAVDGEMNRAPFSNYGDAVDIVAPGVGVYTTAPDGSYMHFSGTSAAAPFAAAALAALMSENPRLSPEEAREKLLNAADNLGKPDRDLLFGEGMINLKRALERKTDSIHDAALTTLYFEPAELEPGLPVTVHFVLENQGTRTIRGAEFLSRIAGETKEHPVISLEVGECREITIPWTVPMEVPEGEVAIEGYLKIDEADSEPQDNGRGVILHRSQWM